MQNSDRITVEMGDITELAVAPAAMRAFLAGDTVIAEVILVSFSEPTLAAFRRAPRHG